MFPKMKCTLYNRVDSNIVVYVRAVEFCETGSSRAPKCSPKMKSINTVGFEANTFYKFHSTLSAFAN